jgi:hypothetical protein
MECPRCHTENPPQAKFCLDCASALAQNCASCGTPLPPAAKFCLECTHPVSVPGQTASQAHALRLLAELAAGADPPETEAANARYDEALRLATELGMRPLVAHCHLGLGRLASRIGDRGKAAEHLMTATATYREMGMAFWLEKAEVAWGALR